MLSYFLCGYAQCCALISVIELPRIPAYCPKIQGTGFGMAITRKIVKMMNGHIAKPLDINKLSEILMKIFSYCSQVIFREVFCHEYGKIPRHTGQNPITEGDLEWILTKLL